MHHPGVHGLEILKENQYADIAISLKVALREDEFCKSYYGRHLQGTRELFRQKGVKGKRKEALLFHIY